MGAVARGRARGFGRHGWAVVVLCLLAPSWGTGSEGGVPIPPSGAPELAATGDFPPPAPADPPADSWRMQGHDGARTGAGSAGGPALPSLTWFRDMLSATWGTKSTTQDNGNPVVGPDGTIYLPTQWTFFALNPDGTTRWTSTAGAGTRAAPAVSPTLGVVYVVDERGSGPELLALATVDGSVAWTLPLDTFGGHHSYSSIAIGTDETVYVGLGSKQGADLYPAVAAVKPDGSWKWKLVDQQPFLMNCGLEAPVTVAPSGHVYVVENCGGLIAVDPEGHLAWRADLGGGYAWPTPAVGPDGTIYLAGETGTAYGAPDTAAVAFRPDGTEKWRRDDLGPAGFFAGMAVSPDGAVVFRPGMDGTMHALDSATGATIWSTQVDSELGGSPALAGNGLLYVQCTYGHVHAFDAQTGEARWSHELNSGAMYWGAQSPALGPDGTLYAVAAGAPAALGDLAARLYAFSPRALSVDDVAVTEGHAGTVDATFTVSLSPPGDQPVTVDWCTADGTATILTSQETSASGAPITTPGPDIGSQIRPASPYPGTIYVPGLGGPVRKVAVTLQGVTHPALTNVDVLLVGPGGQRVMLMSDVWVGATASANVVFDDSAPLIAEDPFSPLASGTYHPTDRLGSDLPDAFPAPAPAGPWGTDLAVFTGLDPTGLWSLYVVDDFLAQPGSIASWSLTFTVLRGGDYTPGEGTLTFAPGETSQTVTVAVAGDTVVENDESFTVTLSAPSGAGVYRGRGQGTVVNDDTYPIVPLEATFGPLGGTGSVSVTGCAGCPWPAVSHDPSWLTITSGSTGTGSGTVTYTVAANPGPPRTGTMTIAGHTFIVTQGPHLYPLTVARAGTGSGSVASTPGGVDCGTDCSEDFPSDTVVTLTASPAADSVLAGWSGEGCAGTGSCVVTMTAARTVTATFTLKTWTLTVTRDGTGSGTVSSAPPGVDCGAACVAPFDHGTVVTLSPSASPDSTFAAWSGACTGPEACTVTMDQAHSVTATFTLKRHALTVSRTGTGSGTVASDPAGIDCGATCSVVLDAGTSVTLTATPDGVSRFDGWSGACSGTAACQLLLDQPLAVQASFTHTFVPGDVNDDRVVNVGDVFHLISSLFAGGPAPIGPGDVDGNGQVDVTDVFFLINYLFADGPAPRDTTPRGN